MAETGISETIPRRYYRLGREWGEESFDAGAGLIRAGTGRHLTRESLYFARILLDSRDDAQAARATGIINAVLDAQITREDSPVRGNFTRHAGETEEDVWDPNWACFNAQTILEILSWHGVRLDAGAVSRMETALVLCAEHDLKRWVSPAYTNIALLTALGLLCGGDRLRDRRLEEAGRAKLREVRECVRATGAFEEYNSPTYAAVNLRTLATWLMLSNDDESAARAKELWRIQWESVLAHAHARTGQLAGPHGRAYGRDMLRSNHGILKFHLHRAIGANFPLGATDAEPDGRLFPALMVPDPDCPDDIKSRWMDLTGPRTVTAVVDSCSVSVGLPAFRRHPPYWRAEGSREKWAELIRSKGDPFSRAFRGQTQRTTTFLGEEFCLGTVSAEAMGDQAAPLIAHWRSEPGIPKTDYVAALALKEEDGALKYFSGAVMCLAQKEGRVLGVLRFGLDEEEGRPPEASGARLAFQFNADAEPEIIARGNPREGVVGFKHGVVVGAHGILCGARILQARVRGASLSEEISSLPAPHSHPEGEIGVHLKLGRVSLAEGDEAYVAFAFEVCEEQAGGGVAGIAGRLATARVAGERNRDGWVRLVWGADLSLETSTRVLPYRGWLTPEGEVRTGK